MLFDLLSSFVGIVAVCAALNLRRGQRPVSVELTPNCLLTKRPLIFVTGARTPFYFSNYFNEAPAILREHGYQVETLRLPWLSRKARRRQFTQAFMKRDAIWVVDQGSSHEFADLLNSISPAQVWTLSAESPVRPDERVMSFLHRLALLLTRPDVAMHADGALHFANERTRLALVREAVLRAELEWQAP